MNLAKYIFLIFAFSFTHIAIATPELPDGFREPNSDEKILDENSLFKPKIHLLSIAGDYNNDGIKDFAKIIVNDSLFPMDVKIYAFISKNKKYKTIKVDMAPGRVNTIRLKNDSSRSNCFHGVTIDYGTTTYCWDSKKNAFSYKSVY